MRSGHDGKVALHFAVERGHHKAVRLLIKAGVSVDLIDEKFGETPFLVAVEKNDMTCMKLLKDADCNIYAVNKHNQSALAYAIKCGHPECLELLLEWGFTREHVHAALNLLRSLSGGHSAHLQNDSPLLEGVDNPNPNRPPVATVDSPDIPTDHYCDGDRDKCLELLEADVKKHKADPMLEQQEVLVEQKMLILFHEQKKAREEAARLARIAEVARMDAEGKKKTKARKKKSKNHSSGAQVGFSGSVPSPPIPLRSARGNGYSQLLSPSASL